MEAGLAGSLEVSVYLCAAHVRNRITKSRKTLKGASALLGMHACRQAGSGDNVH